MSDNMQVRSMHSTAAPTKLGADSPISLYQSDVACMDCCTSDHAGEQYLFQDPFDSMKEKKSKSVQKEGLTARKANE